MIDIKPLEGKSSELSEVIDISSPQLIHICCDHGRNGTCRLIKITVIVVYDKYRLEGYI